MSKKNLARICITLVAFVLLLVFQKHLLFPFNLILFLCVYALIGGDIVFKAVKNLFRLNVLDENFLMTVATVGAFIIGEYTEGVADMLFYQTGELFQNYATEKSRKSVASLMEMCPDEATVLRNGVYQTVYPEEIEIGETIIVKAGEKIALDGIVESGNATLDMSALTGESIPNEVGVGDSVLSGSINLNGVITVKTQKSFSESTVSKILDLVQNASAKKAKVENFISRFAKYYTPAVCASALVIAFLGSIITKNVTHWVYTALSFLVISCPCALVISVPMGFFGGIGSCSRRGVLVKGGNYLELLAKANVFLFDKTGTLTKGELQIESVTEFVENSNVLQIIANCEQYSNHPIAKAIIKAKQPNQNGYQVSEIAGRGLICQKNGQKFICGNADFLIKNAIEIKKDNKVGIAVYLAKNGVLQGVVVLRDKLKNNVFNAIKTLKKGGATCKILSGDRYENVSSVANESGVNEYIAGLLPNEKVEKVQAEMQNKKATDVVCFVGDGINDAPALMRADLGIAMGALGSDSAIEASDVVITNDDLSAICTAKKIAVKTMRIVRQNVIFSLAIKFLVLILCIIGIPYPMWFAVFADVGVAFLAILNSMRCLSMK